MAKKYRCPYCKDTYERDKLVEHIEVEHEDMIPEGFTPARVVFAVINHKDHGVCVVCKKNTKWDEDRGKYERLCSNPNCRKKLREVALKNHMKVYKVPTLLNDEEHQEKMLSHRKIAGEYTFSDGGKLGYVGTFEHKLLEFFDLVLKVKSKDILEPGPVLEYDFHGKTKKWITDFLYIPYNLVIEVKDGGDNPNKRQMPEYRDKQLQKEKMITNLGTYNYLRLTNNNFAQLLGIFAEMKEQMIDDTKENAKAIVRIYEAVSFVNESIGDKLNPLNFSTSKKNKTEALKIFNKAKVGKIKSIHGSEMLNFVPCNGKQSIVMIKAGVNDHEAVKSDIAKTITAVNKQQSDYHFSYTETVGKSGNGKSPSWSYVIAYKQAGLLESANESSGIYYIHEGDE